MRNLTEVQTAQNELILSETDIKALFMKKDVANIQVTTDIWAFHLDLKFDSEKNAYVMENEGVKSGLEMDGSPDMNTGCNFNQVAEFGIIPFLSMMAYISISLGLINLFPIPMLDGGHLMFYGFEKVLGRPLSQKTQEGFFRIGMFLLLSLMFFATFNDLKDIGLF